MHLLRFFLLIGMLTGGAQLRAAGPVVHAYLSEMFFHHFPKYSEEEKQAFRVGTLFPDIRYLGEVARSKTHFPNMTLREVLEDPSPFMAGVKFHSYVDLTREKIVKNSPLVSETKEIRQMPHMFSYLKMIEDEIVYPLQQWEAWNLSLQKTYPEELEWGVSHLVVQKWHNWLHASFYNPPSTIILLLTALQTGFLNISKNELILWNSHLKSLSQNEKLQNFVMGMIEVFEQKMIQEKEGNFS